MITKRCLYNIMFVVLLLIMLVCKLFMVVKYAPMVYILILELLFLVVLYELFKYNNAAQPIFIKVVLVYLPILFMELQLSRLYNSYEINKYGSTTGIALVYNKVSYHRSTNHTYVKYTTDKGVTIFAERKPSDEIYNKLKIGDTILIAISNYNVSNYKIINYFPTHEEIQEFKKGKPYEPKKQNNK